MYKLLVLYSVATGLMLNRLQARCLSAVLIFSSCSRTVCGNVAMYIFGCKVYEDSGRYQHFDKV